MRVGRIIIAVIIGIIVIWLGVVGLRALFGGGPEKVVETPPTVLSSASSGSVRWVQDEKIVAPENHYEISITINAASRILSVSRGYEGTSVFTQSFSNDQLSYNAFAAALDQEGFLVTKTELSGVSRESACPMGSRYDYQMFQSGNIITHDTWNTSCGKRYGDFGGNAANVRKLFQAQIPDYSKLVSDARKAIPATTTL